MSTVSEPAKAPSPARTYSFMDPAFGIRVASSEKLIACMYIVSRPIASASRKIQLALKPWPTLTRTVVATISPKTVLMAVGRPTARRSSCGACGLASTDVTPLPPCVRPLAGGAPRFVYITQTIQGLSIDLLDHDLFADH